RRRGGPPPKTPSARGASCAPRSPAAFLRPGPALPAPPPPPPPVRGHARAESIAVDYARRAVGLDGGRGRARRRGRRLPRVAATLVLDEERGRENIARSRLVDFGRGVGVDVIGIAVDVERRPALPAGDGAERAPLQPRDGGLLAAGHVLLA